MARISKKEQCLKKQTAYECEIDELYALRHDILIDEHQIKMHELEQLLLGAKLDAKYMALDWTANQPNEPWAHWNLAKAYNQLGEYFDEKKKRLAAYKNLILVGMYQLKTGLRRLMHI